MAISILQVLLLLCSTCNQSFESGMPFQMQELEKEMNYIDFECKFDELINHINSSDRNVVFGPVRKECFQAEKLGPKSELNGIKLRVTSNILFGNEDNIFSHCQMDFLSSSNLVRDMKK